jgi:beta-glucuronidase
MHFRVSGLLLIVLSALILPPSAWAQEDVRLGLSGEWHFALDPHADGEDMGWHHRDLDISRWDEVQVPHTWSIDPRYLGYIGTAWYRKTVDVPEEFKGKHVRLAFDAVFYKARVWVNGTLVGRHEGGYTPFQLDVTSDLEPGQENVIVVEVNNSWSRTTIPGARFGEEPNDQVYPWWDYGGIIRTTALVATTPVYVVNQKVVTSPDLETGSAALTTTLWVVNTTNFSVQRHVGIEVAHEGGGPPVATWQEENRLHAEVRVPARDTIAVRLESDLLAEDVRLWSPDQPHLYLQRGYLWSGEPTSADRADHVQETTFGIRKVEVRNAQLLLNGEPIKMGGANRHSDYPGVGSIEPDSVIEQDMTLLKEGNMQLMRLHHYPSSKNALRWADRHGMLLIGEAGTWGFGPEKLSHAGVRALFRSQTEEMIRRDWNHPSVIGWSVGNEYQSDTPEGVAWTQDMYAFVKELDDSRPVTFVSLGGKLKAEGYEDPASTSFDYVDFICANFYYSPEESGQRLDATHAEWPNKPILVSEWGRRADHMPETERIQYIRDFIDTVRARDYVIGASFWSYNDYRSRYPGTNKDGYRHWGLVDAEREPRGGYYAMRKELAPLTLAVEAQIQDEDRIVSRVEMAGRTDFPRYTLRNYEVRARFIDAQGRVMNEQARTIEELEPGEIETINFVYEENNVGQVAEVKVDVVRPTGFSVVDKVVAVEGGS